ALAESSAPLALDDLEEEGGAILHRLGEELQQVAFLVLVGQDAQLAQRLEGLLDRADPLRQLLVIGIGYAEELHAIGAQPPDRLDDVAAEQRDVLHAGAAEPFQVLVDLALLAPRRRLVDRE